MQDYRVQTERLPTDHAGLATQAKLDELMLEQGLDPAGPEFDAFPGNYKAHLQGTITTHSGSGS